MTSVATWVVKILSHLPKILILGGHFFHAAIKPFFSISPEVTRAWVTERALETISESFPLSRRVKLTPIPAPSSSSNWDRVESTLLSWVSLTTLIDQHILPIKPQKFAILQAHGEERFLGDCRPSYRVFFQRSVFQGFITGGSSCLSHTLIRHCSHGSLR